MKSDIEIAQETPLKDIGEIAADLRCGQGKVKSSLFRTRKALRAYLEQEGIVL